MRANSPVSDPAIRAQRIRRHFSLSPIPYPLSPASTGFSLIEILVALVVFAAMAAITWGALGQIARTRDALAAQQDRFAAVARTVGDLERDLRQAISRPVRGNYGEVVPALLGSGEQVELSRVGFANPRAETRSNIERVAYALDQRTLQRNRWSVLDRAAGSVPDRREMIDRVSSLRFRFLDAQGIWRERWPPREVSAEQLPRAVEWRITLEDFGELRRVIALPSSLPEKAAGGTSGSDDGIVVPPITVPGAGATP